MKPHDSPFWTTVHRLFSNYGILSVRTFIPAALIWIIIRFFVFNTFYLLDLGIAVLLLLTVYAHLIEPKWIRVTHTSIPVSGLTKPIRIALLSDLQLGNGKKAGWARRVTEKTINLSPDLVLLAGDLVNNQFPQHDETSYLNPLKDLKRFPIFWVIGNHEYGMGNYDELWFSDNSDKVVQKMSELNIPLLRNAFVDITINDQNIRLFGSEDVWSRPLEFSSLYPATNKPLLFLTHNPDAVLQWPNDLPRPTLTLAGHSHGGQIALFGHPLGDATMRLPKEFYSGLNMYNNAPVYTSVGLGESSLPIRFGVRPEIAVIELVPKT